MIITHICHHNRLARQPSHTESATDDICNTIKDDCMLPPGVSRHCLKDIEVCQLAIHRLMPWSSFCLHPLLGSPSGLCPVAHGRRHFNRHDPHLLSPTQLVDECIP